MLFGMFYSLIIFGVIYLVILCVLSTKDKSISDYPALKSKYFKLGLYFLLVVIFVYLQVFGGFLGERAIWLKEGKFIEQCDECYQTNTNSIYEVSTGVFLYY